MKRLKVPKLNAVASSPMASKSEDDYRGEDDHRTLTRAEEVRADPKRMEGVVKHQRKSEAALARVKKALGPVVDRFTGRRRPQRKGR